MCESSSLVLAIIATLHSEKGQQNTKELLFAFAGG